MHKFLAVNLQVRSSEWAGQTREEVSWQVTLRNTAGSRSETLQHSGSLDTGIGTGQREGSLL